MRGCLCWAQILQIDQHRMLVTTTLIIVMTTSLAGGFLLPILIPRLGLESPADTLTGRVSSHADRGGEGDRGGERGGGHKRESLLRKSYKKHPKYHSLKNLASTDRDRDRDRDRGRRKLSVYYFNGHADAEDDLYGSPCSSPHRSTSSPSRPPTALSNSTSTLASNSSSLPLSLRNSKIKDKLRSGLGGINGKIKYQENYEETKVRNCTFSNVLDPSPRDPGPTHFNINQNNASQLKALYGGEEEESEYSLILPSPSPTSLERWNDNNAKRNRTVNDDLHGYQRNYGLSSNAVVSVHGFKCRNTDIDNSQDPFPCTSITTAVNTARPASTSTPPSSSSSAAAAASTVSIGKGKGSEDMVGKYNDLNDFSGRNSGKKSNLHHFNDNDNIGNANDSNVECSSRKDTEDCARKDNTASDNDNNDNDNAQNNNSNSNSGKSTVRPSAGLEHRATSNWGDHNKYKKIESVYRENTSTNTKRLDPGSTVSRPYGKNDVHAERRSGSQFISSHEIENGPGHRGGHVSKTYKTASAIVDWVNFDEEFLKPFFGGSRREFTPTSSDLQPPAT